METFNSFSQPASSFFSSGEVNVPVGIVRNWQPPSLPFKDLLEWTTATTEVATIRHLAAGPSTEALTNLMSEIHLGLQVMSEGSPQKDCRQCDAGCAECCHVMIAVTAPEALMLGDYLRANRSDEELHNLIDRTEAVTLQTLHLDYRQHATAKVACPLLTSKDTCSAYPARPVRCRSWYSLSSDRCQDCFAASLVKETVPLDAYTYTVGQGISEGLSTGLQSLGMDATFYELGSALVTVLKQSDAAQRWLDGEDVFQGCKKYQ